MIPVWSEVYCIVLQSQKITCFHPRGHSIGMWNLTNDAVSKNCRPLHYTSGMIHLTACAFTVLESSLHYHLIGIWVANSSDWHLISWWSAAQVSACVYDLNCQHQFSTLTFYSSAALKGLITHVVRHTATWTAYMGAPGSGNLVVQWQCGCLRCKLGLEEDMWVMFRFKIQPVLNGDSLKFKFIEFMCGRWILDASGGCIEGVCVCVCVCVCECVSVWGVNGSSVYDLQKHQLYIPVHTLIPLCTWVTVCTSGCTPHSILLL